LIYTQYIVIIPIQNKGSFVVGAPPSSSIFIIFFIFAIRREKLLTARLCGAPTVLNQRPKIESPILFLYLVSINMSIIKSSLQFVNKTCLMRCVLLEALLTTLKSPQSSGMKSSNRFRKSVMLQNLVHKKKNNMKFLCKLTQWKFFIIVLYSSRHSQSLSSSTFSFL
jgi:hypothetical protein